jgi:hypothetical protein
VETGSEAVSEDREIAMGKRMWVVIRDAEGGRHPVSSYPPQQKEPEPIGQQKTAAERHEGAGPVRLAEIDILQAFIKEYKAQGEKSDSLQRRNLRLARMTAFLVLFYATVAAFQWHKTREANQIAREALSSSERPWLGVASIVLAPLQIGQNITATVLVQNFGKTPALATIVRVRIPEPFAPEQRAQAIKEALTKFDESRVASEGVLFPGQLSRSIEDSLMYPMDEKGIGDFRAGKGQLLVITRIRYRDQFGQPHHTQRCGVYNPKKDDFDETTIEEKCDEAD